MKLVLGLIICISIFGLVIAFKTDRTIPVPPESIIGTWEGKDEQGRVKVLLAINPSDLVFQHGENGKSTIRAYTLYEGIRRQQMMNIEGFEERFIVHVSGGDTLNLYLTDADAWKESAPEISMVTFYRRR